MSKKMIPLLTGFIIGAMTVHFSCKCMKKNMTSSIVDDILDKKNMCFKKIKKMFE